MVSGVHGEDLLDRWPERILAKRLLGWEQCDIAGLRQINEVDV